jgi:four helix bundle protein
VNSVQYSVPKTDGAGKPPGALPYARSFHELRVYQKARVLSREVFKITKRFPKEETYSLTDQWRRAARSIGAQISESWAKRRYPKHFVSKLSDADGEQMETQHWAIAAFDDGYISREEAHHIGSLAKEVGSMLGEMMNDWESFCSDEFTSALRETPDHYFVPRGTADPLDTEN